MSYFHVNVAETQDQMWKKAGLQAHIYCIYCTMLILLYELNVTIFFKPQPPRIKYLSWDQQEAYISKYKLMQSVITILAIYFHTWFPVKHLMCTSQQVFKYRQRDLSDLRGSDLNITPRLQGIELQGVPVILSTLWTSINTSEKKKWKTLSLINLQ